MPGLLSVGSILALDTGSISAMTAMPRSSGQMGPRSVSNRVSRLPEISGGSTSGGRFENHNVNAPLQRDDSGLHRARPGLPRGTVQERFRVPPLGRRGYRLGRVARLYQRHRRLSGAWWIDRQVAQEPNAHVGPERQSSGPEPFYGYWLLAGTPRVSAQGPSCSLRRRDGSYPH